jgi:ribosomal protein S18 acetylase RimI-like enzyme
MEYRKPQSSQIEMILDVITDADPLEREGSRDIILERIKEGHLLCAFEKTHIVGFLGWKENFENVPGSWYLEQITIKKELRGMGIGKKLLEHFMAQYKSQFSVIYGHIQTHNERSQNLFLHSGWSIDEEKKNERPGEIRVKYVSS